MDQLKEMQKLLEEINSDLKLISDKETPAEKQGIVTKVARQKIRQEKPDSVKYLESVIKMECMEIKKMIKDIDNQTIADSVSKMVVTQLMAPLQDAISSAVNGKSTRSIGVIAEDMKRKIENLSDRHIRVVKCLSQANGEWVNYDYLSGVCKISQSCLRGYISDLKRVYDIPIESSRKDGRVALRIEPRTVKRLALGYQAAKIAAMDSA
jgi:hypothetical protein